jgi:hypothetical protein
MSITGIIRRLFGDQPPNAKDAVQTGARHGMAKPWHAVSIVPCREVCTAGRRAVGARYLSKEAPSLPLAGCNAALCQCRYTHHDDRRHELRRAGDVWTAERQWAGRERRARSGRRATDQT